MFQFLGTPQEAELLLEKIKGLHPELKAYIKQVQESGEFSEYTLEVKPYTPQVAFRCGLLAGYIVQHREQVKDEVAFRRHVRNMRAFQKAYFKAKRMGQNPTDQLRQAKQFEAQVDIALAPNFDHHQPTLF